MPSISYEDFEKVDIRCGLILKAEDFPAARKPAYKLWVDFGPLGVKQSSAQVTRLYTKEELAGRQVMAVVNFQPKQVADFISEVLVLGIVLGNGEVALVAPDRQVPPGMRLA